MFMEILSNFFKAQQKAMIFGAGSAGLKFLKYSKIPEKVVGFIDSDFSKKGSTLAGITIYHFLDVNVETIDVIYIASEYYKEIELQISNDHRFHGISIQNIYKTQTLKSTNRGHINIGYWDIIKNFILCFGIFTKASSRTFSRRIQWLDTIRDQSIEIRPAHSVTIIAPSIVSHFTTERRYPPIAIYTLNKIKFRSIGRSFLTENNIIVMERVVGAEDRNQNYSAGQVIRHTSTRSLVINDNETTRLPDGILINCGSEMNYFHCLTELIPQLFYLDEIISLSENCMKTPVFFPRIALEMPAIREVFQKIIEGKKYNFHFLEPSVTYYSDTLRIINLPNFTLPHRIGDASFSTSSALYDSESLSKLRKMMLNIFLLQSRKDKYHNARIFLFRGDNSPRKYNELEVFNLLKEHGFIKVDLATLSIYEQIEIFQRAEAVIGASGAAWANLVFANPKVKFLMWMAKEALPSPCFSGLAGIFGVDINILVYTSGAKCTLGVTYLPYNVDLNQLNSWVSNLRKNHETLA